MWVVGSKRRGVVFEEERRVAVAPRGSGSGSVGLGSGVWGLVGLEEGARFTNRIQWREGTKCERRPALRHAHKTKDPVGF
jgi:hypothetical protein